MGNVPDKLINQIEEQKAIILNAFMQRRNLFPVSTGNGNAADLGPANIRIVEDGQRGEPENLRFEPAGAAAGYGGLLR